MKLYAARNRLAEALCQAIAEHGQPNSFGCDELARLYGGPPAMLAGRIGSDSYLLGTVRQQSGQPELTYVEKRFRVPAKGDETG
jgi:hypothetical protein